MENAPEPQAQPSTVPELVGGPSSRPSKGPSRFAPTFQGHLGYRVILDPRGGDSRTPVNPTYKTTSSEIGRYYPSEAISGEYPPVSMAESLKDIAEYGLNGRFTTLLANAGMPRNQGLTIDKSRSRVISDPTAWGSTKAP
eukprot:tig00000459_g1092.t1